VNGCLTCPNHDCLDLLSTGAIATNGVVPVRLRCRLTTPCAGALLILQSSFITSPSGAPPSQWVGGSDFRVGPETTADVEIGLTTLGRRLVSSPGGYKGLVVVQLKVYGTARIGPGNPAPPLVIHS
jgi:hypothetical protein